VRPMVTFSNGIRCVSADKEFLGADVRPDDADDDAVDATYAYDTDYDDDESLRPPRPASATPPQRAAAARRAAAEAEEATEPDMALEAPCVRCGAADHVASACLLFTRDRGAQHSQLAAQAGVYRDIGDDGTRVGARGARAAVEIVPSTPNSFYAALSAACVGDPPVTRSVLCNWISRHGATRVDGHPLRDWVAFEADKGWSQARHYANWMRQETAWAGPIDCAAFAASRNVSLHVWRRVVSTDSYQQHASFHPSEGPTSHAVHLLHSRGRHYDVLRFERRRSPLRALPFCLARAPSHWFLCPQPRRRARLSGRRRLPTRTIWPSRRCERQSPRPRTTLRTFSQTCGSVDRPCAAAWCAQ
jgi:hypothetical protein